MEKVESKQRGTEKTLIYSIESTKAFNRIILVKYQFIPLMLILGDTLIYCFFFLLQMNLPMSLQLLRTADGISREAKGRLL